MKVSGYSLANYFVYLGEFEDVEDYHISEHSGGSFCFVEEKLFIHAFPKGGLVFGRIEGGLLLRMIGSFSYLGQQ